MRRSDREIKDINEILDIMNHCDSVRIALNDTPFPYIFPMNFGLIYDNNKITLYFHCASEGKKLDLIKKDPHVSFEMDTSHRLVTGDSACDYTMEYRSVCGNGICSFDTDKQTALDAVMKKFSRAETFKYDEKYFDDVTVFKIDVLKITGKKHIIK